MIEKTKLEAYVEDVRRTFKPTGSHREHLIMTAMGLSGEAGEVSEEIKKHLFHDKRNVRELVKEELGDTLAYLVAHADAWGLSIEEIMSENMKKRAKKYP